MLIPGETSPALSLSCLHGCMNWTLYYYHFFKQWVAPDLFLLHYRMLCASPCQWPAHPMECCVPYSLAQYPENVITGYVWEDEWKWSYHFSSVVICPVSRIENSKSISWWNGNWTSNLITIYSSWKLILLLLYNIIPLWTLSVQACSLKKHVVSHTKDKLT